MIVGRLKKRFTLNEFMFDFNTYNFSNRIKTFFNAQESPHYVHSPFHFEYRLPRNFMEKTDVLNDFKHSKFYDEKDYELLKAKLGDEVYYVTYCDANTVRNHVPFAAELKTPFFRGSTQKQVGYWRYMNYENYCLFNAPKNAERSLGYATHTLNMGLEKDELVIEQRMWLE
jgi:hypothetical protein